MRRATACRHRSASETRPPRADPPHPGRRPAPRTQRRSACSRRHHAKGRAAPSASAEARSPACDVVDERVDERRLHPSPARSTTFDRAAVRPCSSARAGRDAARRGRPARHTARGGRRSPRATRSAPPCALRSHAARRAPRRTRAAPPRRSPREQLLELVDGENRRLADRWSGSPGRTSAYARPSAGSKPA